MRQGKIQMTKPILKKEINEPEVALFKDVTQKKQNSQVTASFSTYYTNNQQHMSTGFTNAPEY